MVGNVCARHQQPKSRSINGTHSKKVSVVLPVYLQAHALPQKVILRYFVKRIPKTRNGATESHSFQSTRIIRLATCKTFRRGNNKQYCLKFEQLPNAKIAHLPETVCHRMCVFVRNCRQKGHITAANP